MTKMYFILQKHKKYFAACFRYKNQKSTKYL